MTNIPIKKTQKLTTAPINSGNKTQTSRRTKMTKKARLTNFLRNDRGADIGSLSERLDWLPHTTRAALSKLHKSGYVITSVKSQNSKLARYRIKSLPEGQGS